MDQRVASAISHWAPRFVSNGVLLADFEEVTGSIERWEDWCVAWSARAKVHEDLGRSCLEDKHLLSAGEHLVRAAIYYHFAKFVFVQDPVQMKAAHRKAVDCYCDALPFIRPPGERVAIPFLKASLYGVLRKPLRILRQSVVEAMAPERIRKALGEAIARRRKEMRITQSDLANLAQLGQADVSRIESAEQGFDSDSIFRLSRSLGSSPAELFLEAEQGWAAPKQDRYPVLIMAPGLDSTKEELHAYEEPFLARGIAVLAIDGPGQGEAEYEIPICGDYERAAKAVVDWIETRKDLDEQKIAIWGVSLGGYYAPRAAAYEKRIRACIALSGPFEWDQIWDDLPELTRETFRVRSHAKDEAAAKRRAAELTLVDCSRQIHCPLFIVAGRQDRLVPASHAERLARSTSGPVELLMVEDGGHNANNRPYRYRNRTADWLAAQFGLPRI